MNTTHIASIAALVALTGTAFATDRKVPAQFPTITAAVAAASAGDRIVVGPGVWQENVVSALANLQFVGKGAIWDGTLTNGTAGVCLAASGGGIVVTGFTFRAGTTGAAQVVLAGDDCRVSKCKSVGPAGARFIRIAGLRARVDACTMLGAGDPGIDIQGADAVVQKLTAQQCLGKALTITGDRAVVTKCSFRGCRDGLNTLLVTGANAQVTGNQFLHCDRCLKVDGSGALVERNRFTETGSAIWVIADNLAIRNNVMTTLINDSDGIRVSGASAAGGGVIERNTVTDAAEFGIWIAANNVAVRNNRAVDCGTEFESAFFVQGTGNTLTSNTAKSCDSRGFNVTGANNTLANCTATDCAGDGFHLSAAGNTLTGCKATLCTGEGLDNQSTGTTVTGCTFKGNRIDVANTGTFANDATFDTDNSFVTGGRTQPSQVD